MHPLKLISLHESVNEGNIEPIKLTEEEQLEKELCEASFYEFVKAFWFEIARCRYVDGWHIGAFCDHLQTMHMGGFNDLIYNGPFRAGKSNVLAVALPAWIWIDDPTESFLYGSYKMDLSERDSKACNGLVKSEKYQKYWGHSVKIDRRYDNVSIIGTTGGGYRIITSIGGGTTGFGANWIIVDDPNSVAGGKREVSREATNWWYDNVIPSRFRLIEDRKRVVGQQRVHVRDLSGHVLSKGVKSEWIYFYIPEEFEPYRKCKTVPLWNTRGKEWEDPRTKKNELMWPAGRSRKNLDYLKEVDFNNDQYVIAGQLQQRPFPDGGGMIKREWFVPWQDGDLPQFEFIMQSWDTALTGNTTSAYSACTTWGIFRTENNVGNAMLLSLFKGHLEGPDLRYMAKRLFADYRDISTKDLAKRPLGKGPKVKFVLVESKASGFDLAVSLKDADIPTYGFNPTKYGGKIQRARLITYLIENGRIWLPTEPPKYQMFSKMSQEFIGACESFPNDEVNDIVDSTSQALIFLDQGGYLKRDDETPTPADPLQSHLGNYVGKMYKEKGL